MAELVMLFGIGFFVAALLGLLIVLYVHNRFARLGSVDQSHADVHQLEQKLAVTLEERSKLEREIAANETRCGADLGCRAHGKRTIP